MPNFKLFEKISDQTGGEAALKLHAFFGGTTRAVYVPVAATPGHVIEKIIGRKPFEDLVAAFPGETLPIQPLHLAPLRNAGRVWALSRKNVSRQSIAGLLGITPTRVSQIKAKLNNEGFTGDEIMVGCDFVEHEGADHD